MAKILIVEDKESMANMLKETLELDGHEVVIAGDGAEGIKKIKDVKVYLVLTDLKLPKKDGLEVYVMCEIPSNVLLADEFLDIFDGMSIGSNDLTQLILGIDRDGNDKVRKITNENNDAVKELIKQVIGICKKSGKYIGICGQAPSDYPEFAKFLVNCGIDSISLNPDTLIKATIEIAKAERG